MDVPKVVFVTGDPGVGKTHLAKMLGERFSLPVFSKDEIKEPLMDILGWTDKASTRRHGAASYEILCRIIRAEAAAGRSIIIESPFPTEESNPITPTFEALQTETGFQAFEVLCTCEPNILYQRLIDRAATRHTGHFDRERLQRLKPADLPGRYDAPLRIDSKVVKLDLSYFDKVDYEAFFNSLALFLED